MSVGVLGNVVLSQARLHAAYGGVYPNLAKREHAKNLLPILQEVLAQAKDRTPFIDPITVDSTLAQAFKELFIHEEGLAEAMEQTLPRVRRPAIDCIAVTAGPGLAPALWVGVNFAKALSLAWHIPLLPINHMEGHLVSSLVAHPQTIAPEPLRIIHFPALVLLVSGGHTELILMEALHTYRTIGKTRDDAVGECFDKVARMLDLPYPGGPEISRLAQQGHADPVLTLPRPMMSSGDFDFSFSGLKTAVLYLLKEKSALSLEQKADLAYEFEAAISEVLAKKMIAAAKETGVKTAILGGGVSANTHLRETLTKAFKENMPDVEFFIPPLEVATDNALMIAVAAALHSNTYPPLDTIRADGNWSVFRDKR
jgi:N6-L-threonylcarbamoyladenine synthase